MRGASPRILSVWVPAPMERGACAHGKRATRHAPLDRHRRDHLPHGVACRNRRTSGDVQEAWSSVLESPHEPGSGAPPAGAVRCERGARRKAGAVPWICRAVSPESAREGSIRRAPVHEIKFDGGPTTWTSQYRANASTRSLGELPVRHADSRCWHHQDRGRSAKPARACSGCRLALATRTDSSASLVASVKIRSADERV